MVFETYRYILMIFVQILYHKKKKKKATLFLFFFFFFFPPWLVGADINRLAYIAFSSSYVESDSFSLLTFCCRFHVNTINNSVCLFVQVVYDEPSS